LYRASCRRKGNIRSLQEPATGKASPPAGANCYSVSATGDSNVWVGTSSAIYYYDGLSWRQPTAPG
jgi:hypothetical protein